MVKEDSFPLRILPQLKEAFPDIDFQVTDPNENFPPKGEKEIIILDTVIGIDKPKIIHLSDLTKTGKTPVSPHDYDLLFHLLLLKKTKRINEVKIIGVPEKGTELCKLKKLIESFL